MPAYSATDKVLHRLYLGNYSISRAALEMEEIVHGKQARQINVNEFVFVTGLARSGTTAVMRRIFETGEYASLQYSNMPFILNPNLWKRQSKISSHERAHKDGILIDGNSPEEFDEYFWKAHLKDQYIKEDGLVVHEVDDTILAKYDQYVKLICLAKGKDKYVSKNNNNILRIQSLRKIEGHKIIILFRDPLSHASSLLKLHKRFTKEQEGDPFSLQYFDYLGHHEFGLHHKPFLLTETFEEQRREHPLDDLNYWLCVWHNYYSFVLQQITESDIILCFEDLITKPDETYKTLSERLELKTTFPSVAKHKPSEYTVEGTDNKLLSECLKVYGELLAKRIKK